jgi:DNA-binding transcriptional LysR family regulator
MEFSQIRHFLAVAQALHFGRAAEQLHMTQPHLSRAIAKLEAELGVQLFLRTSRKVRLTAAGQVLRAEALELVQGQQRAALLTQAAAAGDNHVLRIGFVSAALYHLLPALLREWRVTDGGARPELREMSTQEQVDCLASGEIDLGLGHPPIEPHGRIVSETLGSDRFDALLPTDHHLASQTSVTFAELASCPFVLFPETQGPVLYASIRDQCRLAGHSLLVAQTASRLHSQCSLIAAGLGVGLAPIQSRSLQVQGTVRVPIRPYPASLRLPLAVFRDARRHCSVHEACLQRLRRLAQSLD